MFARKTVVM